MNNKTPIVLFESKEKCCACGACLNICPKQAIAMVEDECGYYYPSIDETKCIKCGLCKKVCAYQFIGEENRPLKSYVSINKDVNQKLISASGGVFAAMATKIINDGGIVFGCALDRVGTRFVPHIISISDIKELNRLQGSKYVQSSTEYSFQEVQYWLQLGKKVLYSGTPCQIAGLKSFLKKDYENLILVDLICHGVPSARFFNDYLSLVRKKKKWKAIVGYSFRDKKKGWGMNCRIDGIKDNEQKTSLYIPARLASYNTFFLDGLTYRVNCYTCKYASKNRPGDITIGDYWGVMNEHPEIIGKNGFIEKDGISCMIVNTEKGIRWINEYDGYLEKEISDYDKVAKMNKQLNAPSEYSPKRDILMETYRNSGYEGVEALFKVKYRKQRFVHYVFNKLPRAVRNIIKKSK